MNRVKSWVALRQTEAGEWLVRAVQSLYEGCEARVKVHGKSRSKYLLPLLMVTKGLLRVRVANVQ